MAINKNLLSGSTTMLILKLLDDKDMYGYQMIDELSKRSDDTFSLKAGTLYPLLHNLEEQEMIESYEEYADGNRIRKYYKITKLGKKLLIEQKSEWNLYAEKINKILEGGVKFVTI
jgi:PadR family transcriptional regulator PadR